MSVEIKTASVEPIRQNFGSVARRFGVDKAVSRYQEASFDLQPLDNFHYRPIWDPEREIYDRRRTLIEMQDWDAFKDPRQFYYATYVINRARMQESVERNFEFVEKNALISLMSDEFRRCAKAILPLRHLEWAANNHNCFIAAYGFGSPITQAAMYNTTDRLGIAQYISRIGLLLDGNSGEALLESKEAWMNDPKWQGLRKLAEDMLVVKDWFELFIAQNLVIDGLLNPLVYGRFTGPMTEPGASTMAMLTEFMTEWFAENQKWVDACVKTAATESERNRELLQSWAAHWATQVRAAIEPLARTLYGEKSAQALSTTEHSWHSRCAKLTLSVV